MSAASDALGLGLSAARQLVADVETQTLKRTPLPAAPQLSVISAKVSDSIAQLQSLLQALEDSTAVAAKKAQDAAAKGLRDQVQALRKKIEEVDARIATLHKQGAV